MSSTDFLLLGNGFDLFTFLPTRYIDFLNTVTYLLKNKENIENIKTVGDVFGSIELQAENNFIKLCYEKQIEAFNSTKLEQSCLIKIIELAEKNPWFKYLIETYNKAIGWIDFEKEIYMVISAFKDYFDTNESFNPIFYVNRDPKRWILSKFEFWLRKELTDDYIEQREITYISDKYIHEFPFGSGLKTINKSLLIESLWLYLDDFRTILRLYISNFIDASTNEFDFSQIPMLECFENCDFAVTFNYSNTFEKFVMEKTVYHIHGNANPNAEGKDIVLGVNPTKYDELIDMDTSFVKFKKYFQRTFLRTDIRYLSDFQDLKRHYEGNIYDERNLSVIGHSLDESDKDILMDLFEFATKITIFYHSDNAFSDYITNLIKLFGKTKFEKMRASGKLVFAPLN